MSAFGVKSKASEEAQMKYKPKSVAALHIALGGTPMSALPPKADISVVI
jgi:hypothetical protein